MKYRQDARQKSAAIRTQQSLESWERMLKDPPSAIHNDNKTKVLVSGKKEVEVFIQDKINKAKKCLANLKDKEVLTI